MRWDQHVSRAIALRTDVNLKPIRATNGRHDRHKLHCLNAAERRWQGDMVVFRFKWTARFPYVGTHT
jgi:hypothetical protein